MIFGVLLVISKPKGKVSEYTIVVPRTYLAPDPLDFPDEEYDSPNAASQATTRDLMAGLGVHRCGKYLEGVEGHYAHITIIPIHELSPSNSISLSEAPYHERRSLGIYDHTTGTKG
ncbi:unnamed protein product [Penicillium camemberti]|uniref:Str. FM013 n=1 Tax=Penicillium camemberti (strain FM 013) TaxID=1429867 RepID=A0A0G4P740_PENC3|nr:unnamed protein product [Penicillium camemberti]